MSNYKIRVENEAESKEAQELFFELGYKWPNGKVENLKINEYPTIIRSHIPGSMTWSLGSERFYKEHKEITLPQLRDIVVLKRNDPKDAAYTDQDNRKWFISSSGVCYVWQCGNSDNLKQWDESSLDMVDLKLIEKKEMKEYLVKNENTGAYDLFRKYPDFSGESDMEIPEGAESYVQYTESETDNTFFLKKIGDTYYFANKESEWEWEWYAAELIGYEFILWQRHTQPEELPFVDDEPSLNDQYAEIEKVRQMTISGHVSANLPDFEPFKPGSLIDSLIDSNLDESKYPQLDNSDINFRVAKAFNEIRGTDLTEDDLDFIRKLIDLTVSHYLKIED